MRSAYLLTIVTLACLVSFVASRGIAEPIATTKHATLNAGDVIEVTIGDLVGVGVETTKRSRIGENGNISLPLIGSVKAAGLTEAELEKSIAAEYKKAKLIEKPEVSVKNFGPTASTQPAEKPHNAK